MRRNSTDDWMLDGSRVLDDASAEQPLYNRLFPFDESGNGAALGGDETVDLGGVGVEEIGDPPLLFARRRRNHELAKIGGIETPKAFYYPLNGLPQLTTESCRAVCILKIPWFDVTV